MLLYRASQLLHRACTDRAIRWTVALVSIGAEVRRRRRAEGFTLDRLAERSKLSPHFISRLETGRVADPALSTIRALAKGLGCEAGELLGAVKGMSPAAVEVGRLYDAAPAEIQSGVEIILRAAARKRR